MSVQYMAPHSRERLSKMAQIAPTYLQPILKSVRDFDIGFLLVPQANEPFRIPKLGNRPSVVLIGDDTQRADGPRGFHDASMARAIRACEAFSVISSVPQPDAYSFAAAMTSIARCNTMIVETRIEQELPWLEMIQRLAPGRFIWLATVHGGRA